MRVNGVDFPAPADQRRLLSDHLRHDLGLTGTHVGCEHGVCGCCTVLFDGAPVRSCLMLAVQAEGHDVTTIEGLAADGAPLHPVQRHRLPLMPSSTCSAVGFGCCASSPTTDITKPGVQKPHCKP